MEMPKDLWGVSTPFPAKRNSEHFYLLQMRNKIVECHSFLMNFEHFVQGKYIVNVLL